eukprot:CAMPEP_0175989922 /NCGR_PEP_ID=MMETSP0108-20121206/52024_1 /TAXON_ID=195067 ORGANISM="Goniomonas pacifica, Strain CCMP1869" /NCGR_SAMPLE_ID=MMETSP0108 /ASSEMBLY_ACC=CAM_ASM_000204 /LENGTH=80 /DNA_ID=CAMNT_0017321345 /DNA_START=149 /DNA_END=394 /DNA_ORIENTATION=-
MPLAEVALCEVYPPSSAHMHTGESVGVHRGACHHGLAPTVHVKTTPGPQSDVAVVHLTSPCPRHLNSGKLARSDMNSIEL